jgi:hypothetical protein
LELGALTVKDILERDLREISEEGNKIDYLEEAVVCLTVYRTGAAWRANKSLLV